MKTLLTFLSVLYVTALFAQDPVIMTIDGKEIKKSEFETVFKKNNRETNIDKKMLDDYMELYINFRLKVLEAEEMGLDTTTAFKNELMGYRRQLAQPYLTDSEVSDQLVQEAYDRMKTDVRASHILIRIDPNALPKDTLEAYNKAMKARARVLKGEDFKKVAKELSEDPSAAETGGDLGYFTSLQMVYPFESAAYSLKPGEVSMPVRTKFGYHIIKVTDKRPAKGTIQVAHIMVDTRSDKSPEDSARSKAKIEEIYSKVKAGGNFEELAKQHSDDQASAQKGGALPWFGAGRMVPEFENAAFALQKNGDISEPIQTKFGWHILKRLDHKPLAPFDSLKADIKMKVAKDSRAEKSRESLIRRIRKEYGFKEVPAARKEMVKLIDSTFFKGEWRADRAKGMNAVLFTIGDKSYTQQDFAFYLASHQLRQQGTDPSATIERHYKNFVDEMVIAYEDSQLEKKYPQFRALMQEYRDGILIFELTDQKVWSKAIKDTAGLEAFYNNNKEKFMWDERLEATIYTAANEEIAEKAKKLLAKAKKKNLSQEDILKQINAESQLNLKVESGKFSKGDNPIIDQIDWIPGISKNIKKDNQVVFVDVKQKLPRQPKTLKEAKGLVTAEYQAHLEKEWIKALREKHKVDVNREVLYSVK